MRIVAVVGAAMTVGVLASCAGFVAATAWTTGVSREDASNIGRAIRAQKEAHQIYRYARQSDGTVLVTTDKGYYTAKRLGDRWEVQQIVFSN